MGVSLIALVAPTAAVAQTAAATTATQTTATPDDARVEEAIIVTARRRDESIQDVPAVVNAVTTEQVQKLNLREFNEVQTVVPGLNLTNNQNGTGGAAQLRGVTFDTAASGNNPTVEFYQNDAPITAGVVLQQMYDVGQIEVLRGPQGTLRGRASPSGSITVTTRKADLYSIGGYASMTGNDIGTINTSGAVGIPIIEGVLAVRAAGVINYDDANRVRTINGALDGRDPYSSTKSGRISAILQPIEALRFEGMFQRLDRYARVFDQVESFNQVNAAAAASPVTIRAKDRLSNQETPRMIKQRYDIYNGRAELALAGQRLIYQFQHYTQFIDSGYGADFANAFVRFDYPYRSISNISSTSHELRLQNEERVGGFLDYVAGVFDNKNSTPTNIFVTTPVFLPAALGGGLATLVNTPVGRAGNSHERSAFGNLTAHLGEATEISGGARFINYKGSNSLTQGTATTFDPPIDDNKVIYSASVKHSFSRNFLVYASTGSSYRPGIYTVGDFSVQKSALQTSFLNLPSESSKSYEAGIKTTLLDGRARFNISGFHQTFKNSPYRAPGNSGQSGIYYINYNQTTTGIVPQVGQFNFVAAVPIEVNGGEAEIDLDVSNRLKLALIGSYSIGRIKNGTVPCNDLNRDGVPDNVTSAPSVAQLQAAYGANNLGACVVNQRSSFQSPFSATVQAEYGVPVTRGVDGYLRGLFTFNGNSQVDPTNIYDDLGSFGLLNLFAGVRDPKGVWEVSFFAKNLLDTTKVLSRTAPLSSTYQVLQPPTFRSAAATTTTSTYTGITTTPPREFGLNVRFAFGSR